VNPLAVSRNRGAMIRYNAHSEAGGHSKNEDYFVVQPLAADPDGFLCALADGQGGRAGGARAAEVACQTCREIGSTYRPTDLVLPPRWDDLIHKADLAVSRDRAAGLTTLVVFCITPEFVCGASCGDSAVAVCRRDAGEIVTERQLKDPPVGSGEAVPVPFFARLTSPWILLAMSDGVWKFAGWENILNLDPTRRVEELTAEILRIARLPSGQLQDDFTLVVFQRSGDQDRLANPA
jgi:hypothetical protein